MCQLLRYVDMLRHIIFLPAKVEVWASVDGKNFTLLGSDICSEEEAGKDVIFRDFGWIGTPLSLIHIS